MRNLYMKIVLGGPPGSGKSTVAKKLTEKYKLKYYSMGGMRREIAEERGLSIAELNATDEKEKDYKKTSDYEVDLKQIALNKSNENFVIEGRLCYHFITNADIKIYLDVSMNEAVKRAMVYRPAERYENLEQAKKMLKERQDSDSRRYKRLYKIKYPDPDKFDYIIDTTNLTIEQVFEKVDELIKSKIKK